MDALTLESSALLCLCLLLTHTSVVDATALCTPHLAHHLDSVQFGVCDLEELR